jgi:hypothetical protein
MISSGFEPATCDVGACSVVVPPDTNFLPDCTSSEDGRCLHHFLAVSPLQPLLWQLPQQTPHCCKGVRKVGASLVDVEWSVQFRTNVHEVTSQVLLTLQYGWLVWLVPGGVGVGGGLQPVNGSISHRFISVAAAACSLYNCKLGSGHPPLGLRAQQDSWRVLRRICYAERRVSAFSCD